MKSLIQGYKMHYSNERQNPQQPSTDSGVGGVWIALRDFSVRAFLHAYSSLRLADIPPEHSVSYQVQENLTGQEVFPERRTSVAKPRASKLQIQDLNVDVIYEIFSHFIAIDKDGPFTLFMVCMQWQELIIKNPCMWTWITIDDAIVELEDRIQFSDTLSAGLPLQLTITIPIDSVYRFGSLVKRSRFLFLDVGSSEASQNRRFDIEPSARALSQIIRSTSTLKQIYWSVSGKFGSYSPSILRQQIFTGNALNLKPLFDVFPPIMISSLQLMGSDSSSNVLSKPTYYRLWDALRQLPYLTSLALSGEELFFDGEQLYPVLLPHLHELTLQMMGETGEWNIINYLRLPSIHLVNLRGILDVGQIFTGTSLLGEGVNPKHLNLEILSSDADLRWMPDINYHLSSVERFEIIFKVTLGIDYPYRSLFKALNHLIAACHDVSSVHIGVMNLRGEILNLLDPIPCIIQLTDYEWSPFHNQLDLKRMDNDTAGHFKDTYFDGVQKSSVKMLMERSGSLRESLNYVACLPNNVRTLKIQPFYRAVHRKPMRLISMADISLSLEVLDVGDISFSLDEDFFVISSLPCLRELRCPLTFSIHLLKHVKNHMYCEQQGTGRHSSKQYYNGRHHNEWYHTNRYPHTVYYHSNPYHDKWSRGNQHPHTGYHHAKQYRSSQYRRSCSDLMNCLKPKLQKLTISIDFGHIHATESAFESLTEALVCCRMLNVLGLEFYPSWRQLISFLSPIIECIKLPALPHPLYLERLVRAFHGEKPEGLHWPTIPSWEEYSLQNDAKPRGCYYCLRSGWTCYAETPSYYCNRHSLKELVTITKDTLIPNYAWFSEHHSYELRLRNDIDPV